MLVAAVGLGCYLATLLLYSETITPFQRFPGISSFVGDFAPLALALSAAVAAGVLVAAWRGVLAPARGLLVGGGLLYVASGVAFATATLTGLPGTGAWGTDAPGGAFALAVTAMLALPTAVGCVAMALAWGRVYKGLTPRRSLAAVALAGLVACALGVALMVLPAFACVVLYGAAALVAAVLPAVAGACAPAGDAPVGPLSAGSADAPDPMPAVGVSAQPEPALPSSPAVARPLTERLRSFLDVAAPAFAGLLAFAFVMGTMRELIVEAYPIHIATMALVSIVLLVLGLRSGRRPLTRLAERSLIPVLAVTLLAVGNVTAALWGGAAIDMVMIYLLYTLAAALTLASLSAMAHAGEFSSDAIFATAVMLFSLASYAGLKTAELVTSEQIRALTAVVTTVYAFAMVLLPGLLTGRGRWAGDARGFALDESGQGGLVRGGFGASGTDRSGGAGSTTPPDPVPLTRAERCAELAERCGLTAREAEVLAILAEGHSSGYISEALYISPNTVRTHMHNIYRKLGVGSREDILLLVRDSC